MKRIKITPSKTNRSVILEQYFTDISKYPILTEDEEVELSYKIKEGDQEALQTLVQCNLRFVVSVAKQYQGQGLALEDLIQEGNLGLQKAAERFDPTKGFKFISYAVFWITQNILQALSQNTRIIRLPMNQIGNLTKLGKLQNELSQVLGRIPNEQELAEKYEELSVDKIGELLSTGQYVSIDGPISQDDDSTMVEVIPDSNIEAPDAKLMHESDCSLLHDILDVLSERERNVLSDSYGINEEHKEYTIEELSQKFNLTKERIRQIRSEALTKAQKYVIKNNITY